MRKMKILKEIGQSFLAVFIYLFVLFVTFFWCYAMDQAFGAGSYKLVWNPSTSENVDGYKIYFSRIEGGPYEQIDDITNEECCEYPLEFYGEEDLCCFRVTAYNEYGESDYSNEACLVYVPTEPPDDDNGLCFINSVSP